MSLLKTMLNLGTLEKCLCAPYKIRFKMSYRITKFVKKIIWLQKIPSTFNLLRFTQKNDF